MTTPTRYSVAHNFELSLALLLGAACIAQSATLTITPSAVSNDYNGMITIDIAGGLTNGESVRLERFLDVNGNGTIDSSDWLSASALVTDGQASIIGGVTNVSVPRDVNPAGGAITCPIVFQDDSIGNFVSKFIYCASSPSGRFTPVTSQLTVTNSSYAQTISGSVLCNGTNVPQAAVGLFVGDGMLVAGVLADSAGNYSIDAPAGGYMLAAFKPGYYANFSSGPIVVLPSGGSATSNVWLTNGTRNVSGKLADATVPTAGIPGALILFQSQSGLASIAFTDSNGDFTGGVSPGQWQIQSDSSSLGHAGYLEPQSGPVADTTTGNVSGRVFGIPKGTALIYGHVTNEGGQPILGAELYADTDDNQYDCSGISDANGDYAIAVQAGGWNAGASTHVEYLPPMIWSGGRSLTISSGQAVRVDYSTRPAAYHITGSVHDDSGNPVSGVNVYAYANIGGQYFNAADIVTDSSGHYSLDVSAGTWWVGVNCEGDQGLTSQRYQCVSQQQVVISGSDGIANFTVYPCSLSITSSDLPDGDLGAYYDATLQVSGCGQSFQWSLAPGSQSLPSGLILDAVSGEISGYPTNTGTFNFTIRVTDELNDTADKAFSVTITAMPLQIVSSSSLTATQGQYFTKQLAATGGEPPYKWSLHPASQPLPANLTLSTNGLISGVPETVANQQFIVRVTDSVSAYTDQTISLTVVPPPLQIVTTSLPDAMEGVPYTALLTATGGYPPYNWTYEPGSQQLPPNLQLSTDGQISGTPITNGVFYFFARVSDNTWPNNTTNRLFSLNIRNAPTLNSPSHSAPGTFQFLVEGTAGQTYTIKYSTNLDAWLTLFTTNPPAAVFRVVDPNATNAQRSYRVLIGP